MIKDGRRVRQGVSTDSALVVALTTAIKAAAAATEAGADTSLGVWLVRGGEVRACGNSGVD